MSSASYAYAPTSPALISKALGDVFSAMESGEQRFNRSAHTNVIVATSSRDTLGAVEKTLDALSLVHPSRFFVVYIDDSLPAVATEISARCHGLSRSEHACSEVVRLGAPRSKLGLIPSVVRGHFMVGTPAELYLADGAVSRELVDCLTPLVDLTIFDSEDFAHRLDIIAEVARLCPALLDLEWIKLGPWRDEIKAAFSRAIVRDHLPMLTEVSIDASGGRGDIPPLHALLLAGWILDRLELVRILGHHGDLRASFPRGGGRQVRLRFGGGRGVVAQIEEVAFRFGDGAGGGAVSFVRGQGLETHVELERRMRWSRPLEEEDREGLIRRYFLIGESTANYNAALRGALSLRYIE
jgi:glucose-6-phosphate dehydrogenase assembly protein OpcA